MSVGLIHLADVSGIVRTLVQGSTDYMHALEDRVHAWVRAWEAPHKHSALHLVVAASAHSAFVSRKQRHCLQGTPPHMLRLLGSLRQGSVDPPSELNFATSTPPLSLQSFTTKSLLCVNQHYGMLMSVELRILIAMSLIAYAAVRLCGQLVKEPPYHVQPLVQFQCGLQLLFLLCYPR